MSVHYYHTPLRVRKSRPVCRQRCGYGSALVTASGFAMAVALGGCQNERPPERTVPQVGAESSARTNCPSATNGEVAEIALARCLVTSAVFPASRAPKPVTLYLDRSGSMRGFLDPGISWPDRKRLSSSVGCSDCRLTACESLQLRN